MSAPSGADESRGAPRAAGGDDLPPELVRQSLSSAMLILPLDAALEALALRAKEGRCLESWEGWVRLPDGSRAKSLSHGGSFALPSDPAKAADRAREGMRRAQSSWERDPEYPGAALYFGLSFAKPRTA